MKIFVIGNDIYYQEFREKFSVSSKANTDSKGNTYYYSHFDQVDDAAIKQADVLFDFAVEENPDNMDYYRHEELMVFGNAPKTSLSELVYFNGSVEGILVGFNGLPSLFNRPLLELSLLDPSEAPKVAEICSALGTEHRFVEDRVGMVTPRVLCMIINEAFYTVMEGTATVEDINKAMKLGTGYPYGPFEFAERIGYAHVYETLEAIYADTKDERYKICPLLKKKYLTL